MKLKKKLMLKIKLILKNRFLLWPSVALFLLMVGAAVVYAFAWDTGYRVDHSTNQDVIVGSATGPCHKVTNTSTDKDIFVPTKSQNEWDKFDIWEDSVDWVSVGSCIANCTSSATFGSGVTQFTVQPIGSDGAIKTGTCDGGGVCDGLPAARCNSGTWGAPLYNTCRAKDLIWLSFSFPGGLGDCSGAIWCTGELPGAPCTTEGAGCATYCLSGAGGAGLICADRACSLEFTGSTFAPICPTCNGGGITCPVQSYTTSGGCGDINLGAYSAGTKLNLACPGGCVGTVSANCDAGGAWTNQANTCHQPVNCGAGSSGSGDTICTYLDTKHGKTVAGNCNKNGTCSVSCFDGTASVTNNCIPAWCGGNPTCSAGERCDTCPECACGTCSFCTGVTCMSMNDYCRDIICGGEPFCWLVCMGGC